VEGLFKLSTDNATSLIKNKSTVIVTLTPYFEQYIDQFVFIGQFRYIEFLTCLAPRLGKKTKEINYSSLILDTISFVLFY